MDTKREFVELTLKAGANWRELYRRFCISLRRTMRWFATTARCA